MLLSKKYIYSQNATLKRLVKCGWPLIFVLFFSCKPAIIASDSSRQSESATNMGVPASPYPLTVQQPDGTSLQVLGQGDERISYAETIDGYTILRNTKNIYEYAIAGKTEKLELSGVKANDPENRAPDEEKFLLTIDKHLRNN